MKNKKSRSLWLFVATLSTLVAVIEALSFTTSGSSQSQQAFDVGQFIGVGIWATVACFSWYRFTR